MRKKSSCTKIQIIEMFAVFDEVMHVKCRINVYVCLCLGTNGSAGIGFGGSCCRSLWNIKNRGKISRREFYADILDYCLERRANADVRLSGSINIARPAFSDRKTVCKNIEHVFSDIEATDSLHIGEERKPEAAAQIQIDENRFLIVKSKRKSVFRNIRSNFFEVENKIFLQYIL